MNNKYYAEFQEKISSLEEKGLLDDRKKQFRFCDLMKELIIETCLKNFNKNTLTAFIQISGAKSKDENVEKYIRLLELDSPEKYIDQILDIPKGQRGLTGAAKASIDVDDIGGNKNLEKIRLFLIEVIEATSRNEIINAIKNFESYKIDVVKAGIFSPWLTYLKPEFCPISNGSTKEYYIKLGWNEGDYISLMDFTLPLVNCMSIKNYILLDAATREDIQAKIHNQELKTIKKPSIWVEKTYPESREVGKEFSKVLFSPQRGADGRDTYKLMKAVRPGDIVIHLTDNLFIKGVSIVEGDLDSSYHEENPKSEYFNKDCFLIALKDYKELLAPIKKEEIFENDEFRSTLTEILNSDAMVFFNKRFDMNQGAYLTQAPLELIQIFNSIYNSKNNKLIPHLEIYGTLEKHSYWVFQGNPKVYDVTRALNDNMVDEWWVKSHKDKINIGDKGIIWVTGKDSGCYAFFKVTSKIYEKGEDENHAQYYFTEMKNDFGSKVQIEIELNLAENPILKESVKGLDWFQDFNGGNQGTTFQMTKKEYEEFLKISTSGNKPNHWMIACGAGGEFWDEFQRLNRVSIGWVDLKDHRNYKSRSEIEEEYIRLHSPENKPTNNSLCIWEFSNEIKKGDIVFVKKGRTQFLAAARITSDKAEYDSEKSDHQMYHSVEWLKKKNYELDVGGVAQKSLTGIDQYPDFVKKLRNIYGLDSNTSLNNFKDNNIMKNTILFGPPGTGKTYNTIAKAVSIANPDFNIKQDRDVIKAEYDRLVDLGQIVFTTFHQSMSYEDFIEGIKPVEPKKEGDPINYKIQPGIFKKLCEEASFSSAKIDENELTQEELEFSDLFDNYVESLREILASGKFPELESRSGGSVVVDKISDQDNIVVKHHDGKVSYAISKYRLSKLDAAFPDLTKVENIDRQFREVIGGSNSSANWSVLNAIRKFQLTTKKVIASNNKVIKEKNFVLIIDEINRGNVSQIFGELITLVENNKRLGNPEAVKVVLPYSKMPFGVPSNVHIVGTMNTADRSVEALDTALRRRFVFEEIPPSLEILEKNLKFKSSGIDLVQILKTINQRLEKLLNKDHLIGHSFFIKVRDLQDLKVTFSNEIVPLLQEYFYGDFGKIGLVLGSGFVENIAKVEVVKFAAFEGYDSDDLEARPIYKIKDLSKLNDDEFKSVVLSILGK